MARDYAAEYARRVSNAEREGFTRSQARGFHPSEGRREVPISAVRSIEAGRPATVGMDRGRFVVAVQDSKGRVKVYRLDRSARDKLMARVKEADIEPPEES